MWWSYFDTKFSTCIKFSMFFNLALTFYLQAPLKSAKTHKPASISPPFITASFLPFAQLELERLFFQSGLHNLYKTAVPIKGNCGHNPYLFERYSSIPLAPAFPAPHSKDYCSCTCYGISTCVYAFFRSLSVFFVCNDTFPTC